MNNKCKYNYVDVGMIDIKIMYRLIRKVNLD